MSDLIDREALQKKLLSWDEIDPYEFVEMVYHAIDSAPTIDAVPVVRCGDCKWLFNDSNIFFKPCEVIIPEKDWYCAYGERREG